MKNPYRACFYSVLLPGLGQIYLGETAKGFTLLCMDAGILISVWFAHSWILWILMGLVYGAVLVPAAADAYQTAAGMPRIFTGDSVPYVVVMLFMVGPFGIPLLWQSPRFSKRAKVVWTVLVVLLAFVAIALTAFAASKFDAFFSKVR
ncbi:MAG: hypothetical protein KTQ49_06375 [Candidatus Omnitrophica bacterium]|nr:hypothetical protein [Candidatus Omnitrophota bacterium]